MSGENAPGEADNQQGSRSPGLSPDGLTPQRLHAELLEADARETRAYLLGALRDGTFSPIHRTIRISQSDRRWLLILQALFLKLGSRSWIYREGKRNVWVIETTCGLGHETSFDHSERTAFVRGYFDAKEAFRGIQRIGSTSSSSRRIVRISKGSATSFFRWTSPAGGSTTRAFGRIPTTGGSMSSPRRMRTS